MFDIELLMNDLKLTQNELATILGVTQGVISKVKNKKMDVPESWVDFLNDKYDIEITKYFREDESKVNPIEDALNILSQSNLTLAENNTSLVEINNKLQEQIVRITDKLISMVDVSKPYRIVQEYGSMSMAEPEGEYIAKK